MNYNAEYITTFKNSEYEALLNDSSKLDRIKESWLNRNNPDYKIEVLDILKKESLDHYVTKQLIDNPSFINTKQMHNYMVYINDLCQKSNMQFITNIIFLNKNTSEKILNKFFSLYKDRINIRIDNMCSKLNSIIAKMQKNELVTQEELEIIARFFADSKRYTVPEYKIFIKYVFSKLAVSDLKFTTPVQNAVLAYLPLFYQSNIMNVRFVLGNTDRGNEIKGPGHSSTASNYVALNKKVFQNVNMKSIEDSKVERKNIGSDISFFMIVAMHELVHQIQKKAAHNKNYNDMGMGYIINKTLNRINDDYLRNHDSDEIEICANERGWEKCAEYFSKFADKEVYPDLYSNCYKNHVVAGQRRIFSNKKDSNGVTKLYSIYDITELIKIVRNNPDIREEYPMLKIFFTEKGYVDVSFMYCGDFYVEPAAREFITYFYDNNGVAALLKKLSKVRIRDNEVSHIINNVFYILHDKFKTYDKLSYMLKFKNQGEYRLNPLMDDAIAKEMSIKNFKSALENYMEVKKLFDYLKMNYPSQKNFVDQATGYLEKDIERCSIKLDLIDEVNKIVR